jgi:hypothetical protein
VQWLQKTSENLTALGPRCFKLVLSKATLITAHERHHKLTKAVKPLANVGAYSIGEHVRSKGQYELLQSVRNEMPAAPLMLYILIKIMSVNVNEATRQHAGFLRVSISNGPMASREGSTKQLHKHLLK